MFVRTNLVDENIGLIITLCYYDISLVEESIKYIKEENRRIYQITIRNSEQGSGKIGI